MTNQEFESPPGTKWRRRVAGRSVCVLALLTLLAWSLHRRVCTWVLEFTIPSGYSEEVYRNISTEKGKPADLSPDGRLLAIGKSNGQCEIWDINELKRIALIGDAVPIGQSDHYPALAGGYEVQWSADGQGVVVWRNSGFWVFKLDGSRRRLRTQAYGHFSASPVDSLIALSDMDKVQILDSENGDVKHEFKLSAVNTVRARLEWTRDGQYLLLNDLLGVWVWDVRTGKMMVEHRVLDLTASPIVPVRDLKSLDTRPPSLAALVDSRFSPDGSFFCSIYDDLEARWGGGAANAFRLRFYDTKSGALLWDTQLPGEPSWIAFSTDGTRLYVRLGHDLMGELQVYDVVQRKLIRQNQTWFEWPNRLDIAPLADAQTLAGNGGNIVLFSPTQSFAPFNLRGSPNVYRIMQTRDGRLIEVGLERTIRIWRQRRSASILGAFALIETWAIYLGAVVLFIGVVMIAGEDAAREFDQKLPGALWTGAVLGAVCLGLIVANGIVSWSVGDLYNVGFAPRTEFGLLHWTGVVCFITAIIGSMRLSRSWWIFMQILLVLGALLCVGLATKTMYELRTSRWPIESIHETLHGWPFLLTPEVQIAFYLLCLAIIAVEIFLFTRPEIRLLHRRSRFLEPGEPGDGFPVEPPLPPGR